MMVMAALRWVAIAICCLLLFQPAFETTTYRRTQNQVHVLIDDSASMRVPADSAMVVFDGT